MDLITQLDTHIDALRDELADLTIGLVNIKSERAPPQPGAPFGPGPRQLLDRMLSLGKQAGFSCTDYDVGVVSLALQDAQPDLGIWLHADVVPAGDGWNFEPYNAVRYRECIIGRGATDNKGQLAAIFLLLRLFRQLQIPLAYNPAIYIGSNEETGMQDLVEFLKVAPAPRLSLVPDSGFPVGYGGKGSVTVKFKSRTPLHGCTLTAGQPADPGTATALLDSAPATPPPGCKCQGNRLTAWTPPRHGAHPDPAGNMITVLSEAMLTSGLAHRDDRYIWEFLRTVSADVSGSCLGICAEAEGMTPLTVFAKQIDDVGGHPELTLNIRYPDTITAQAIMDRAAASAQARGFLLTDAVTGTPAYRRDKTAPMVSLLRDTANAVTGSDAAPFTTSGGTYANYLPNAYVYGANGCRPPADFPKGRGSAHGLDESVSLERLQRCMRIYARTLLKLNETVW